MRTVRRTLAFLSAAFIGLNLPVGATHRKSAPSAVVVARPTITADFRGVQIGQTFPEAAAALKRAGLESDSQYSAGGASCGYRATFGNGKSAPMSCYNDVDLDLQVFGFDFEDRVIPCPYGSRLGFKLKRDIAGWNWEHVVLCGTDMAGTSTDPKVPFRNSRVVRIYFFAGCSLQGDHGISGDLENYLFGIKSKYGIQPGDGANRTGVFVKTMPMENHPNGIVLEIDDHSYGETIMKPIRDKAAKAAITDPGLF